MRRSTASSAVSISTGTWFPFARIARHTAVPLLPGRRTSRITASYVFVVARVSACGPVPAWSTAYSASRSPRVTEARSCRSSSAKRSRMGESYGADPRVGDGWLRSFRRMSNRHDPSRTAVAVLAAISFCHLLNDLLQGLIPAVYPILKTQFALSFGQIGLITLTYQIVASL